MDDFCQKIKSGKPLNFPPLNPTQGCLKEASRLQLNVGEQGSVKMIEDIYQHAQLIHTGQFFFDFHVRKTYSNNVLSSHKLFNSSPRWII